MKKKMGEYTVIIERDENGIYVGSVAELPGCHTQGESIEELMENIKEAIELYLEHVKNIENKMEFVSVKKVKVEFPLGV